MMKSACVCPFGWVVSASIVCSLITGCSLPTGLTHSRWAMDDPGYAVKYREGAKKTDPLGKIKQASDARFLNGANGTFVSGGLSYRGDTGNAATIDIGKELYTTSYLTQRISLTGAAGFDQTSLGLDGGIRLQPPTRLAPFVGVGGFVGMNWETVDADDDGIDNDDDGFTDEFDEEDTEYDLTLASIYPEVGAHFWWTPRWRLTGFGRYWITTDGRDSDTWMVGGGVAVFRK